MMITQVRRGTASGPRSRAHRGTGTGGRRGQPECHGNSNLSQAQRMLSDPTVPI